MAARLEIEIGGSDKGGNAELKSTIGLLEQLMEMRKGLSLDLIQAEDVQQLRAVGENLTSVNTKIGEYLNLATKATQAWRDNRTEVILDNLATKIALAQTNAAAFGASLQNQASELRAYQSAFEQLITNGLDRTSKEVVNIEAEIKRLTTSIQAQKTALAEAKVWDNLAVKIQQIGSNFKLSGDIIEGGTDRVKAYRSAIEGLIRVGIDPADDKIKRLRASITALENQMRSHAKDEYNKSLQRTGSIMLDLKNKIERLNQNALFAKSEKDVERFNKRIAAATAELNRLSTVGTNAAQALARVGSQTSQTGIEFARVVQDLPYAAQNIGSIGNNITRVAELWPQYVANAKAAVVANGQVVTSAAIMKSALTGLVSGWNGVILAISAVVTAFTIWQQVSQKRARDLEKAKKAEEEYSEVIRKRVEAMDAVSRAQNAGKEDALTEINRLNVLRRVVEDETVSRENRLAAMRALRSEYPKHFKNLSEEEILAGRVGKVYADLADKLMKTALAQAAMAEAVEVGRKLIKLETVRYENLQKIQEAADREIAAEKEANKLRAQGVNLKQELVRVADLENPEIRWTKEQKALIAYENTASQARAEIRRLNEENAKASADDTKNRKEINNLQKYTNDLVSAGADITGQTSGKDIKIKEEQIKITKELGNAIKDIYKAETDRGNLVGLEGLYKANQATQNRYQDMLNTLKEAEADWTKYFSDQVKRRALTAEQANKEMTEVTKQVAAERKEIEQGLQNEIIANTKVYATERAKVLEEAEVRAGKARIASRESELAADKTYWDSKEADLKKYNVTADQLTEWRKASEAQIHLKWDSKIAEETFNYQRKVNESMSQLLLKRLNKETEEKIKAAQGDAAKLLEIEKGYQAQIAAIQTRDSAMKAELSFDGSAMSVALAQIGQQMEEVKRQFDNNLISVDAFREKIASLEVQRQQMQLWQTTINGIATSFGSLAGDFILDADNAIQNLGKSMKRVAASMISDLVAIAVRSLLNAAIGKTTLAASTTASIVAAKATASAWATPAALVSAATFGASAVTGGAALTALIASTKAMAGFSRGGYTGNMGRNEIAGFVHGQEFVMNASATRDNMPLLKALNSGVDISSALPTSGKNVNFGTIRTGAPQSITVKVEGTIENGVIKLSNDDGNRDFKRFFG